MVDTTTEVEESELESQLTPAPRTEWLALAVVWALEQSERVGQVILLPRSNQSLLLGRGPLRPGDSAVRARLLRQRPGGTIQTAHLDNHRISRRQLLLRATADAVRVENLGRCPMLHRDRPAKSCDIRPGETVELKNQLVLLCVRRADELGGVRHQSAVPSMDFGEPDLHGLVGESPAMWSLRDQIAFIARRKRHVLLYGETGTGKELAARAIHALSSRADRALVSRNAATIPETLFDAELFGHARDYPNPGMQERAGLVGEADHSTLFLDEIGELPEKLQSHLLRLLDRAGEYHRLGESKPRQTDLRLIAATNRPLDELKRDLLARLTLRLRLPTLNERREDVPLLCRHILRRAAESDDVVAQAFFEGSHGPMTGRPRIEPRLMTALVEHTYTSHVRELETALWTAVTSSRDAWLRLTPQVADALGEARPERPGQESALPSADAVKACLERHDGVQEKVWRELGLKNRYVLRRLIKRYGLSPRSR